MDDNQKISGINSPDPVQTALSSLSGMIAARPDDADLYYRRGRLHWRAGAQAAAITDYEHALALDPASPAKQALEMARSVMDFFNPDLLNP